MNVPTASSWQLSSRRTLASIALSLLVLFSAIGWVQFRQFEQLQQAANLGEDSLAWAYFQLNNEYSRLRYQLSRTLRQQGSSEALEQLQLRYDIFVSRISLVSAGRDGAVLRHAAIYQQTLPLLQTIVAQGDAVLGPDVTLRYQPEALVRLEEELNRLQTPLQLLAQEANHTAAQLSEQRRQTIRQQIQVTSAIAGVLFGLILLFAGIAWRQMRKTEQKRDELAQAAGSLEAARFAAEAASRAKSSFLANMSHEIRTPMNGVLGMLELLADSRLNASQSDYLRTARDSAQHLLAILNDILDISKLEAGRIELESTPCQLSRLVADLARLYAARAQEKQLQLLIDCAADAPDWLEIDPVRLRQILLNLLSNAIKFTEHGSVTVKYGVLATAPGYGTLTVDVIDTGIGMSAAALERLFQRFSQGDASTTRKYGGTGLGLEISRSLARLMSGEITVASREGQGSCFSLRLPVRLVAAPAAAPVAPQAAADSAARCGLKVLAVDDNAVNLKVISALLGKLGHRCSTASDGEQACSRVFAEAFDLVLMDGQMPVMGGLEATRLIRARGGRYAALPIIALTADAMTESREQYLAAGMDDYLSKPVNMASLRAMLEQHFPDPALTGGDVAPPTALHFLAVDDNPVNLRVVATLLGKLGHQTDTAANGEQAVARAAERSYAMILMDLHMPVLGGMEASRRIRALPPPYGGTPIVALSADVTGDVREQCLAAGMNDYFSKPVSLAMLAAAIHRYAPTAASQLE